jgi:hypothetical protein
MDNFSEEMNFINTPQFPGQQLKKTSIDNIRAIIKRQKRIKGYAFTAPIGTSSFNLDLSGTARILLGLAIFGETSGEVEPTVPATCCIPFTEITSMQFKVNNEIVVDTLNPNFLSFAFNDNEYYYLPRPLSGTDQLTMTFQNTGTQSETVNVVIYYI